MDAPWRCAGGNSDSRWGSGRSRQPRARAWRPPRLHHPDQAADHLAAAADHGGDDVRRRSLRPAACRRSCWTMLGGYLAAGGAGAINHYLDRERDARMARTRSRPLVSGRIEPIHGLIFGIVLGALAFAQLWMTVNPAAASPGDGGPARLRLRLHALAEAADPAEHRHRRRRRRGPAAGRLGSGDGRADGGGALALRDRLPLDPAPLLGALAADQRRLRAHRDADAAGRPRRG